MKHSRRKTAIAIVALALLLVVAGCRRQPPPQPPAAPPPAPAPTASLSANPASVQQGQSTQLTWRTENADQVMIEGVGPVDRSGSRTVTPDQSTTYRLVARGPGGTQDATARVTVTAAPAPPAAEPTLGEAELFARNVRDVFYDYDRYDIRSDAQSVLRQNAQFLQQHPNIRLTIEGHCDERGSTEYNLALGDNRALAARDALVQLGVRADRIRVISFGKEKPFCTESNEQCWQQNRRAHFVMQR